MRRCQTFPIRNGDTSNYLFVDGYVTRKYPMQTYQSDSSGKVIANFWYRDDTKPLSANGQAMLRDTQERFRVQ